MTVLLVSVEVEPRSPERTRISSFLHNKATYRLGDGTWLVDTAATADELRSELRRVTQDAAYLVFDVTGAASWRQTKPCVAWIESVLERERSATGHH